MEDGQVSEATKGFVSAIVQYLYLKEGWWHYSLVGGGDKIGTRSLVLKAVLGASLQNRNIPVLLLNLGSDFGNGEEQTESCNPCCSLLWEQDGALSLTKEDHIFCQDLWNSDWKIWLVNMIKKTQIFHSIWYKQMLTKAGTIQLFCDILHWK